MTCSASVPVFCRAQRRIILGEVFASAEDVELSTVVGSCVTVCLYDPVTHAGGMNHFLLPAACGKDETQSGRYGDVAMQMLLDALRHCGARLDQLQAKVFGAAEVLRYSRDDTTVGELNRQFIEACLRRLRIPIVASHIGGTCGMNVRFLCQSGRAYVRSVDRLTLRVPRQATRL